MFIDCHMHAFADKIADKAVDQLIHYYNIPTHHGGHFADLIASANEASLDALIMLVAATKPEQLKPANDWILSLARLSREEICSKLGVNRIPQLIPFGTYHPDAPNWKEEIDRLRASGIKGIKLHPEFQRIDLADPKLNPFWEEVRNDFILMIHVGDPNVSQDNYSTPRKVANILDHFPGIRIIAAHLGGYCFWEDALEHLAGKDVYLDTSSALDYIELPLFRQIVNKHGLGKILFGSDYPLKSPQEELEVFDRIDWLKPSEKADILGNNCAALLNLR